METFYVTLGFVVAVCIGVMLLTAFFQGINLLKRRAQPFEIVKLKQLVDGHKTVTVHLTGGKFFPRLRFIGFADSKHSDGVPYPLTQMVVCETATGARVLFSPRAVKAIEETAEGADGR